jgi:beta-glucosidase
VVNTDESLLWGATLCAHAVEGADFHADWWRWEQRPTHIMGGGTSETAADHVGRFRSDLDLAAKFGCNALQYGISWARIEPESGQFDEDSLRHYAAVFKEMTHRGITPICVLQEHSVPAWFSDQGAWEHPEAANKFHAFVVRVHEALGRDCAHWIPHYEPLLWLSMTYGEQRWPPPSIRTRRTAAMLGLAQAHTKATEFLREADGANRVGVSLYAPRLYAADPHSPWDQRIEERNTHRLLNSYPEMLAANSGEEAPFSFLALSCPGALAIHAAPRGIRNGFAQYEREPGIACSLDEAVPEASSIGIAARHLGRWEVPLLVTGVGVATDDDAVRCHHLLDHVNACIALRREGIDLMGFCYRALLDGFAWHHGYAQRHGLIHVEWESLARTPNPSAFLYQDIIRAGAIRPGAVTRFAPDWESMPAEAS